MKTLSDRKIITLTGPDTIALLERTVTNSVTDWNSGTLRFGALLTPQGKIICDFIALRTADGVWLDTHADAAEDLAKRLKLFRLRSKVEISLENECSVALDPDGLNDPRSDALPRRLYKENTDLGSDGGEASPSFIEEGVPQWGRDFRSSEVFPTDVNLDVLNGIDYKKGCFVGQEVASRMKRRGSIRKRTVTLEFQNAVPPPGSMVTVDGKSIGELTSQAGNFALAKVRVDHLSKSGGNEISVDDLTARVVVPDWLRAEMHGMLADG